MPQWSVWERVIGLPNVLITHPNEASWSLEEYREPGLSPKSAANSLGDLK